MAIAEVIKFEGPQDALVWKFPIEDFNATSQLIVDETHEALLVVNGNAADLFTAGRRTLSVPNIPIARTLIEIPTGGNSPFPCKVFFINKVHAMDLLWGTQGPIVQILSMFLSFKTADVETAFFGIPLASFSIYYLCASLIVGAVFMVFQNAGFTLALVIQTLILAAFLIIAIISLLARDTVQAIGENVKQNVTNLKSILVDVEMLSSSCTDPELKQALNKLADTVKYSDPMSTTAVELVEQRIMRKISELRVSIDNNQIPDALQVCKELELLYVERNKKLALSK